MRACDYIGEGPGNAHFNEGGTKAQKCFKIKKPPKVTKQICFSSWRLETVMGTWSQATESLPAAGLAQAGVHEASRVGPPQGLQASNRLEGGGTQVSLSPWRRPRVWRRCSPKPRACLPPDPRTGEPAGRLPLGVWGRVRGSGAQGEGASRRHGPPARWPGYCSNHCTGWWSGRHPEGGVVRLPPAHRL